MIAEKNLQITTSECVNLPRHGELVRSFERRQPYRTFSRSHRHLHNFDRRDIGDKFLKLTRDCFIED